MSSEMILTKSIEKVRWIQTEAQLELQHPEFSIEQHIPLQMHQRFPNFHILDLQQGTKWTQQLQC
jgi:hypothetical protein